MPGGALEIMKNEQRGDAPGTTPVFNDNVEAVLILHSSFNMFSCNLANPETHVMLM